MIISIAFAAKIVSTETIAKSVFRNAAWLASGLVLGVLTESACHTQFVIFTFVPYHVEIESLLTYSWKNLPSNLEAGANPFADSIKAKLNVGSVTEHSSTSEFRSIVSHGG